MDARRARRLFMFKVGENSPIPPAPRATDPGMGIIDGQAGTRGRYSRPVLEAGTRGMRRLSPVAHYRPAWWWRACANTVVHLLSSSAFVQPRREWRALHWVIGDDFDRLINRANKRSALLAIA
jgi:hypothetical protein